jgi:predicted CoA-binding protein
MSNIDALAADFLSQQNYAVAGISRSGDNPGTLIMKKLLQSGKRVFPVNPQAETIDGHQAYPSVSDINELIDVVVVTTHPDKALSVMKDCRAAGVSRVWLHRSFGQGSFSPQAVEYCHAAGITVIAGGCPMMFCRPVDFGHKCMRWMLNLTGKLP